MSFAQKGFLRNWFCVKGFNIVQWILNYLLTYSIVIFICDFATDRVLLQSIIRRRCRIFGSKISYLHGWLAQLGYTFTKSEFKSKNIETWKDVINKSTRLLSQCIQN